MALSVVLTLGVLEGVFRLLGYSPLYDSYSKPEAFWQYDAHLGWSLKPHAHGEFVGPRPFPIEFRSRVRINSLGFRGAEVPPLPPGGRRVVVMGDSQAAGFEVGEQERYSARLQQILTRQLGVPIQVINAAVRGYGTDQEYLEYLSKVRKLHPSIVVLHLSNNDPDDNVTVHRLGRLFAKPVFVLHPGNRIRLVGTPVPSYSQCSTYRMDESFQLVREDSLAQRWACRIETALADRSALFSFVITRIAQHPDLLGWLYESTGADPRNAAGRNDTSVPGIAQQVAAAPSAGVATPFPPAGSSREKPPPLDAFLPDYAHQLTSTLIKRFAARVQHDGGHVALLALRGDLAGLDTRAFAARGIKMMRPDAALGNRQDAIRFPNDGHLNKEGHRRIANFLAPKLERLLAR